MSGGGDGCPYIGLRYFQAEDAHLYFGRDEHVAELLDRLATQRFVAVLGSSGSGKSSLVRAGLLPELRSGMIPMAGPTWKVIEFRPGRAPLGELASALRSECGVENAEALLEEGPLGIVSTVASAKLASDTNVLIIADQFEEVFTFQREEAGAGRGDAAREQCQALARRLIDGAAHMTARIYVLLVMRSDYLGDCAQFPDLPERMSEGMYLVPRLRRDQLQEAIAAPVGGAIEPAVVQRLLGEVGGDPDQLPRLQHLLARMWQSAEGGRLTMPHYMQAGGWEGALDAHLEDLYRKLNAQQQGTSRRVFQQLSALDRGRAVRRRTDREDLERVCGPTTPSVVDVFRDAGFLLAQSNPVDITHECVLRGWRRLREWIADEDRARLFYRELVDRQSRPGRLHGNDLRQVKAEREADRFGAGWANRYGTQEDFHAVDRYVRRSWWRRAVSVAAVIALAATAVGLGIFAVWSSRASAQQAAELKRQAEVQLAAASFREATVQAAALRPAEALAYAAHALRLQDSASARALTRDLLVAARRLLMEIRHEAAVTAVAWSPDGTRVATASWDKTARVWDARTGQAVGAPLQHREAVSAVAWSPDGTRVATASWDTTARVWDARTGQAVGVPLPHRDVVSAVAWSPDGTRVATASYDTTARVWDARTGQAVGAPLKHRFFVTAVAWSGDGLRVATASQDSTARVWDARTGQAVGVPLQHQDTVMAVAWSADGTRAATASMDKTAQVWDAQSGQAVGAPLQHQDLVSAVAWSPDGTRVATASYDTTARVWDPRTGQAVGVPLQHQGVVKAVAWSADGTRVATASWDKTARVWDPRTGQAVGAPLQHQDRVEAVAWSADGRRIATVSQDGAARVWDARTGQAVGVPLQHQGELWAVAWSADGTRVATASYDKTARVWDAQSGQAVGVPLQHQAAVAAVAWSADGTRVATASMDTTAQVWDAQSGQAVGAPLQHRDSVMAVAWSADGTRVATASWDKTARVWDARTGQAVGAPLQHQDRVEAVAWSPDGTRVATASWKTARVWDARTGQAVGAPLQHQDRVAAVAWSADGTRVATANDNTARVWNARTGQAVGVPLQHQGIVYAVAWSADGTRVATASADKTARVWDARTGLAVGAPLQHQQSVRAVAWSADGTRVATASGDWTARVWDVSALEGVDTSLLAELAETVGGLRVNEADAVVPRATFETRQLRLDALVKQASDPAQASQPISVFLKWLIADPYERTITPFSTMRPDEYIQRMLTLGASGRADAQRIYIGHPLLAPPSKPSMTPFRNSRV